MEKTDSEFYVKMPDFKLLATVKKILSFFNVDDFKVFIEFVTILLLFYGFWFFSCEACSNSAPRPGIEPTPRASEGEV